MKVLVTGEHGQVVRSLLERAAGRDDLALVAIGRPQLDLEVPGSAGKAVERFAPDILVSAAAYTAVDLAEDEPDKAMRVNGTAAGELASAASALGIPIIHFSTDYVFDGTSETPYSEDDVTRPISAYGRSKLLGEQLVRANNPRHLILRTAWVYSPFGKNFLKTMMRVAATQDVVRVVADQRGSPTSAFDIADGILRILDRWSAGDDTGFGEVFHLCGGGSASWHEFAEAIFQECRSLGLPSADVVPLKTEDWPTRASRPKNSVLDCDKLRRAFDFAAPPWRASVRNVVERSA